VRISREKHFSHLDLPSNSNWLTAIVGALVLLLINHLVSGRSGRLAHR